MSCQVPLATGQPVQTKDEYQKGRRAYVAAMQSAEEEGESVDWDAILQMLEEMDWEHARQQAT